MEVIEKMNIDCIVPGCNDHSYKVCAELSLKGNYYGLDTLETTEIINSKDKFRSYATQIGLPVPQLIKNENIGEKGPFIVKPVDAYSGRGITIVKKNGQQNIKLAIEHAKEYSRSKTAIIEEYVEGQLYSHSAFINKGKVVVDFIVEEHGTANPFVVDTSRVVYDFPHDMLIDIRDCITLLVKKLNLVDGLVHTQFMKNGKSFWLIEITRRCPGDLYSQLIELSTGYKYAETYLRPFLNQEFLYDKNTLKQSWLMRHTISQTSDGVLGSIQFNFPVLIEKMVPISIAGDIIKASPFGRIALMFLRSNSAEELSELFQKALDRNLYTIKEAK